MTGDETFTVHRSHGTGYGAVEREQCRIRPLDRRLLPATRPRSSSALRLESDVHDVKATMGRLELMVTEIKATLDATLPHLATRAGLADLRAELKADIAGVRSELKEEIAGVRTELRAEIASVRSEVGSVRSELKEATGSLRTELKGKIAKLHIELNDKPSKTYMWGVLTALLTAYACGLAALAILK